MNFFDNFVIPQSGNHILLIKYMLIISLILFTPYICLMLGATFLSDYFYKKGRSQANNIFTRFAKDIIEKLTFTKSAGLALGTIPLLSIIFAYAQLLYGANTIAVNFMVLSLLLIIIALNNAYKFRSIIVPENEFHMHISNVTISGSLSKYLLLAGIYIFAGSAALASNPDRWAATGNIMQVIFSWETLIYSLVFITFSGMITGSAILFYFFSWQGGLKDMHKDYETYVKNFASRLTLISSVFFPVMVFMNFMNLSVSSQTQTAFLYHFIFLLFTLFVSIYVYYIVRNSNTKPSALIFCLIIIALLINVIKDQNALGNAIKPLSPNREKNALALENEIKSKIVSTSDVDAASIYNTKCIACHKFDQKLVGPPYNETVPKFNGDVNKLAEFIYNPQKIDPAYPPMPNQGLKKKEALAMAKWLIDQVGKK
ncbi:MAG: hypothetical protein IT280_11905 [Ignavibacteria bacterium]|nr:hypothetical protein [Ignavibacteria bacterium]